MGLRPLLSRLGRDALLLLLGFSMMHISSTLSYHHDHIDHERIWHATTPSTRLQKTTTTLLSRSCSKPLYAPPSVEADLPHTSIIAHAPGWTFFRNMYMSNGSLFSNRSFPEICLMTSIGLPGENMPENIASHGPTSNNMDYLTSEGALTRWGEDVEYGEKNAALSVGGSTVSGSPMS